ncbi:MAG: LytR/AlgR family response regulator transcription factor [Bacteroidia bacterium]
MLRAIIIDDEKAGIELIKILASRNAGMIKIVASTQKAEEGIELIEDYKPDVVFLDINMPHLTGFELLEKLNFRNFKLIFTTAHKEYAIQAIRERVFDYLLKPIDDEAFKDSVERLYRELNVQSDTRKTDAHEFIEIQVKDGILFLRQKDIVRLEASRSYTDFYMENGVKHVASKAMKDFEQKLDAHLFYRCHKSHVINLQKVQKFINADGFFALMSDGSKPLVSKVVKDDFLKRLKDF